MLKLVAPNTHSPREVCTRLNALMCRNLPTGRFVTFFYALLNSSDRRLIYANAGHYAPIVMRAGGDVIRLDTAGLPLGLFADSDYTDAEVNLADHDTLILYTDGVLDATAVDGNEFGEEGIISVLRAHPGAAAVDLKRVLLSAVERHCGGVFSDDVTLLVLTVSR